MYWEFGKVRQGLMDYATFVAQLKALVQVAHYQQGVDKKLVVMAVLIQAADVKGLFYHVPLPSWLFANPVDVLRVHVTHQPITTVKAFGYELDRCYEKWKAIGT